MGSDIMEAKKITKIMKEYTEFMSKVEPIFNTDYPEIPADQMGE